MANEHIRTVEDKDDIEYVRPLSITLISVWLFFSAFSAVWLIYKGYGASLAVNTALIAVGGIVSHDGSCSNAKVMTDQINQKHGSIKPCQLTTI